MANIDYGDYQDVINAKKEIAAYYAIAKELKAELTGAQTHAQLARERLKKMSYNVGEDSRTWAGKDAESYAQTARDICRDLEKAECAYLQGLSELMDYFDKESERLTEWINKAKEEMDIVSKGIHLWNAGVMGKMDG